MCVDFPCHWFSHIFKSTHKIGEKNKPSWDIKSTPLQMLIILMLFVDSLDGWEKTTLYRAQQKKTKACHFFSYNEKLSIFLNPAIYSISKCAVRQIFPVNYKCWLYVVNSVYHKRIFRPVSMIKTRTSSIHFFADAKLYNNHILFSMLCSMVCFFTYYFSLRSTHICRSAV